MDLCGGMYNAAHSTMCFCMDTQCGSSDNVTLPVEAEGGQLASV